MSLSSHFFLFPNSRLIRSTNEASEIPPQHKVSSICFHWTHVAADVDLSGKLSASYNGQRKRKRTSASVFGPCIGETCHCCMQVTGLFSNAMAVP